ncbi:unnamed protein product [Trifolium pratense]|uniref:Uncharacterized protein n=1 Tax=Trifolium pratense TaxID=57577 RepID=A0ACB0J755_TRIPR|nr:unnamed protein product [Trifolium pratense]
MIIIEKTLVENTQFNRKIRTQFLSISKKEKEKKKTFRRLELEGAATLFSPKGVWLWYLRFSLLLLSPLPLSLTVP